MQLDNLNHQREGGDKSEHLKIRHNFKHLLGYLLISIAEHNVQHLLISSDIWNKASFQTHNHPDNNRVACGVVIQVQGWICQQVDNNQ